MKFKMENPDKVRNIVVGSFEGLKGLYGPGSDRLRRLQDDGIVSVGQEKDGEDVIVVSYFALNTLAEPFKQKLTILV
jgi:DNA-directed RNA polymerase beta subunit